jgi:LCP family protein required for cell wall assembly
MFPTVPKKSANPTAPRHGLHKRNHRILRGIALVATALIAFSGTAVALVNADLQSKMTVDDVDKLLGDNRPTIVADPDDPYAGQQLNILVMGTDLRAAENEKIAGKAGGMASDTTMVVHISGDRKSIEVVSIPRDSLVDIPACVRGGGGESAPESRSMFNRAFANGAGSTQDLATAAACTIKTVEQLTGVRITSHVVLKMTGVIDVVDAIGGVTMCLPEPVKERPEYGKLDLPAGKNVLDGRTAINFLRARKGRGMGLELGSDLKRIERQQAFLDAAAREILDQNLVTNSPELYRVVKAVLGAVNTSPDLGSPSALAGLAFSLRSVNKDDITFTFLPVFDSAVEGRVEWKAEAAEIWERIINDERVPGTPAALADEKAAAQPTGDSGKPAGSATSDAPSSTETTKAPETPTTKAPEKTKSPATC